MEFRRIAGNNQDILKKFPSSNLPTAERSGAKICPKGAIPLFQYSNIPSFQFNCERSELSSNYPPLAKKTREQI
jgi:hypothetical protein